MEIIIEKETLMEHLSRIEKLVKPKSIYPILENILIEIDGVRGTIDICSTDLELAIKESIQYEIDENCKFLVNGQKIFNIIKSMENGSVKITITDNKIVIQQKKLSFKLHLQDAEDYPELTFLGAGRTFSLKGKDLLCLINKTAFAISKDITGYNRSLLGMFLKGEENKLIGAASDSFRIAYFEKEIPELPDFPGVIIPRKALMELKSIINEKDDISIIIQESNIQFATTTMMFISRLLESAYPDLERFVFIDNPNKAIINKDEFLKNLKSFLSIMDGSKAVELVFDSNKLAMKAESLHGEALAEIDIAYTGEKLSYQIDISFLVEPISHIGSNNIIITLPSHRDAIGVYGEGEDNYKNTIMPLQDE